MVAGGEGRGRHTEIAVDPLVLLPVLLCDFRTPEGVEVGSPLRFTAGGVVGVFCALGADEWVQSCLVVLTGLYSPWGEPVEVLVV